MEVKELCAFLALILVVGEW